MHSVVKESLEEYLAGTLTPVAERQIDGHLKQCPACRAELESLQEITGLFGALRLEDDEAPVPSAGFYAKVVREVNRQSERPSFSSLFALDLAFGRRLVFASLMTLAILGTVLVTRDGEYVPAQTTVAVLAPDYSTAGPGVDDPHDHDIMLVALTNEP
jgi:predicted anti-sigma-YlaC factor YlaD